MAACKKDPGTLNETPNLIFNPKGTKVLNLEATKATTPFAVTISRTMAKEKPLSITIGVDETKLPDGKSLPDADYYSIDQTVIPMGANVGQVEFTVTFESQAMYENLTEEEWDDFALPIVIKSVSPAIDLNAANTTVIIDLTVRGATIIGEAAEHFAEVFAGGEPAKITLNATANYSADETGVSYTVDADGVDEYNTENETSLALLPSSAYSVGAGAWDEREIGEDTNENGEIDANESVKEEIITNEITINTSLAAGTYILPLKLATSEDGINVVQDEPIYILVESVPAATPGIVMNGDFEAPLPYSLMTYRECTVEDAFGLAKGVWRWNSYWWSDDYWSTPEDPVVDADFKWYIAEGQSYDGSDCLVMDCSAGTFDNNFMQVVTGLDPAKKYTLSAKVKLSDVTNTAKSGGIMIGYWPAGNLDDNVNSATYGSAFKDFSGEWGEASVVITSINSDGTALIALRFGGPSSDTDGKAWFDDVKIEEYIPEVTGELMNGDFETSFDLSYSNIGNDPTNYINGLLSGGWKVFNGWNLSYGTSGNGGVTYQATEGRNGSKCIKIAGRTDLEASFDGGVIQKITGLTSGDVYTFSAWIKCQGADKDGHYDEDTGGRCVWWKPTAPNVFPNRLTAGEGTASVITVRDDSDWTQATMEVTVPESGEVTIGVRCGGTSADVWGTFWIDDVTFEKN